jgi:site-specific DNA-methyltransferase (adenine-specific)
MKLLLGDCLDKLKELEDNSVDSIVTDPPYGLSAAPNSGKSSKGGFMGKQWDYDVPSVEIWEECLRVLKPGGHLLAFAGSRTYHRMAVRIEDAGFEIRDMISWLYGSGFPKSMDISKQFDKRAGVEREVVGKRTDAFGDTTESETGDGRNLWGKTSTTEVDVYSTEAVSNLAKEWQGYGTALKPAHEPVVMARKPLSEGTVVDNIQKWRTGGINIDESRIPFKDTADRKESTEKNQHADFGTKPLTGNVIYGDYSMVERTNYNPPGRFPANLILDEEAGKLLDEQSGISKSSGGKGEKSKGSLGDMVYGKYKNETHAANAGGLGDIGGASRFFYCPKTSKTDRNEGLDEFEEKLPDTNDFKNLPSARSNSINTSSGKPRNVLPSKNNHPTVKPTDLMLYLIRLVTPKGGTTLDPFMGSGSTGKGAVRGGFGFIGIEREDEYFKIAEARINYEMDNPKVVKTTNGKKVEVQKEVEETLTQFFE